MSYNIKNHLPPGIKVGGKIINHGHMLINGQEIPSSPMKTIETKEFTQDLPFIIKDESEVIKEILSRYTNGEDYELKEITHGKYVEKDGDTVLQPGKAVFRRRNG